jgi:hypothetical protein
VQVALQLGQDRLHRIHLQEGKHADQRDGHQQQRTGAVVEVGDGTGVEAADMGTVQTKDGPVTPAENEGMESTPAPGAAECALCANRGAHERPALP